MRKKIREIAYHPLISGSFFIFTGGMIASFFNFIFNLLISRNLRIEDYGVFISLLSVVTLISIPASSVIPTIVSISAEYFSKNDFGALKSFYLKLVKSIFLFGILFIIIAFLFSSFIESFLKINNSTFFLLSIAYIILVYFGTFNLGFLQAKLSFKLISFSNILSSFTKLLFGFLLVLILKLSVGGALFSLLLSSLVPIIVGVVVLRKIIFAKSEKKISMPIQNLFSYGIKSTVAVFSINSLISTDIILVKHFSSMEVAGLYGGLSLVGRVIFFFSAPIGTVMFPVILRKVKKNEKHTATLWLSILLVTIPSILITVVYFLIPRFVIQLFLKNPEYFKVSEYLGLFGIFITLFSISYLLTFYFLSINKTKVYKLTLIAAVLQILLIVLFHANILQIIVVSIIVTSLLLISLLLYYSLLSLKPRVKHVDENRRGKARSKA